MAPKPVYKPVSAPEDIREKARNMIDLLVQDMKISNFLEKATWNHAVDFCTNKDQALNWDNLAFRNAYTQKILGVRYNLKLRPDLMDKMKTGDCSIRWFVNAKPWEICSDKWTDAFEAAARKTLRFSDASSMDPENMPDGMLSCGKCKSRKTSYYEMQTRSADEPKMSWVEKHHAIYIWTLYMGNSFRLPDILMI
ncbi:transcription elongation factor S-II [Paramecium bursaria Chlorella virus CVG-1]|nr:transcription elongation factor S-II [Paramecium bursaria Chlorella virus CVG-1]